MACDASSTQDAYALTICRLSADVKMASSADSQALVALACSCACPPRPYGAGTGARPSQVSPEVGVVAPAKIAILVVDSGEGIRLHARPPCAGQSLVAPSDSSTSTRQA
jgi:hypothetical protein